MCNEIALLCKKEKKKDKYVEDKYVSIFSEKKFIHIREYSVECTFISNKKK